MSDRMTMPEAVRFIMERCRCSEHEASGDFADKHRGGDDPARIGATIGARAALIALGRIDRRQANMHIVDHDGVAVDHIGPAGERGELDARRALQIKRRSRRDDEQAGGAAVGTEIGSVVGSIIPGIGTAIGGLIGGGLGSLFCHAAGTMMRQLWKKTCWT